MAEITGTIREDLAAGSYFEEGPDGRVFVRNLLVQVQQTIAASSYLLGAAEIIDVNDVRVPRVGDAHAGGSGDVDLDTLLENYRVEKVVLGQFLNSTNTFKVRADYRDLSVVNYEVTSNVAHDQARFDKNGAAIKVTYKAGLSHPAQTPASGATGVDTQPAECPILIPKLVLVVDRYEVAATYDRLANTVAASVNSEPFMGGEKRTWMCTATSTRWWGTPATETVRHRRYCFEYYGIKLTIGGTVHIVSGHDPLAWYKRPNTRIPPGDIDPAADGFPATNGDPVTSGNGWKQVKIAAEENFNELDFEDIVDVTF